MITHFLKAVRWLYSTKQRDEASSTSATACVTAIGIKENFWRYIEILNLETGLYHTVYAGKSNRLRVCNLGNPAMKGYVDLWT
jgi:hypothetical protein